jgi:predicted permease
MHPTLMMLYGLGLGVLSGVLWWTNWHTPSKLIEDPIDLISGFILALICFITGAVLAWRRRSLQLTQLDSSDNPPAD